MAQAPLNKVLTSNASTDWYTVQGTVVQFMVYGTMGGGAIAVELKAPDGTAVPLADDSNTPVSLTIVQVKNIEVPAATEIRATASGTGGSSAIGIKIAELSDGRTQY